VCQRYNPSGAQVILKIKDDVVCSVPRQWTDLSVPDPEIVMSKGRSYFRVADLLELRQLLIRMSQKNPQ